MKINYYLAHNTDKSSVDAVFHYKGKRFKLPAGVSVNKSFWNTQTMRAKEDKKYTEAETINLILDQLEADLGSIFRRYAIDRYIPTIDEIKGQISPIQIKKVVRKVEERPNLFLPFFKKYYETTNYDLETWKKYNTTYNWLVKYCEKFSRKLTFDDINMNFYDHFRTWIMGLRYKPFKKSEETRFYTANYLGSLVKCIKHVMRESGPTSRIKLHNNIEYSSREFKVDAEQADTVYLNEKELQQIFEFNPCSENIRLLMFDNREENQRRKIESLITVKNKFLIGCYTALRVSDFNRLREVNIQNNYIRIKPKKKAKWKSKNEDVVIPIHPVIKAIINTGFDISTEISDVKINKHIKEICKVAGITEPTQTVRTEGGKLVEHIRPKYELVTTHTARRSGATNMFIAGVPAISIMKITGHRTEKSFMKYIRISQEENAKLLADHPFFKKNNQK